MDAVLAFQALREVRALGDSGDSNSRETLMSFMDLVTTRHDFASGSAFWRNIYKLWLSAYARLADGDFHDKLRKFVVAFNDEFADQEFSVTYHAMPPKSYEMLKADEKHLALRSGSRSFTARTAAAGILDVLRCNLVANSPAALVQLVNSLRMAVPHGARRERFELARVRNEFHESADNVGGCRGVVCSVLFHGGERHTPPGGDNGRFRGNALQRPLAISLVGEVCVTLPAFRAADELIQPLLRFLRRDFDPPPHGVGAVEDGASDDERVEAS